MDRTAKRITLGFGTIALLALAGCGASTTGPTLVATAAPSTQAGSTATATAPQIKVYHVGDTLKMTDGVQLTITGAKAAATLPGFSADYPQEPQTAGNEFIVVSAVATNSGTSTDASVNEFYFEIHDVAGHTINPTMAMSGNSLSSSPILPGDKTAGDVVFEVPPNAAYRLYYQTYGEQATVFDLGTM